MIKSHLFIHIRVSSCKSCLNFDPIHESNPKKEKNIKLIPTKAIVNQSIEVIRLFSHNIFIGEVIFILLICHLDINRIMMNYMIVCVVVFIHDIMLELAQYHTNISTLIVQLISCYTLKNILFQNTSICFTRFCLTFDAISTINKLIEEKSLVSPLAAVCVHFP